MLNNYNSSAAFTIKTTTILWLFLYTVLFTAWLFPGEGTFGFYSIEWSFFFWVAILLFISLISVFLKDKLAFKSDPILILIGIFFIIILFSLIDTKNKILGLLYAGQYIPYFFILYFVICAIDSEEKLIKIIDKMTFLILLFSVILILIASVGQNRDYLEKFLINYFNIGILKVISFVELPFCILTVRLLNEKSNLYRWISFILVTVAIVLTGSRGSYGVWMIIILLAIFKTKSFKKRILLLFIVGIIAIIGILSLGYVTERFKLLFVFSSHDFQQNIIAFSRIFTAKVAYYIMLNNPINGVGIGNLASVMQDAIKQTPGIPPAIISYWDQNQLYQTQTTPLKLGAEIGFGGFIFFFIFYYHLWFRIKKAYGVSTEKTKVYFDGMRIAIIVDFIHNFVDVSFYNYYSWFYYGVIIAATRIVLANKNCIDISKPK